MFRALVLHAQRERGGQAGRATSPGQGVLRNAELGPTGSSAVDCKKRLVTERESPSSPN